MVSRRDFLKSSTLLALAPTVQGFLAQTARAAQPERDGRVLVVVELNGGNDGINTVVPFADEGYARHRRHLRLPTASLIRVNDRVGLHPALRDAARLLEGERLAIVQGVSYPNPIRSHFESMAVWHAARRDPREHAGPGWLGRTLDAARGPADGAPASVYVGHDTLPGALRSSRSVAASLLRLDDLVLSTEVDPRRAVPAPGPGDDVRAFVNRTLLDAYTASDRLQELGGAGGAGPAYPAGGLAEALRLVARLIKARFGTRVYYTKHTNNGYDTHYAQLAPHAALLGELGGALRAFLDDLRAARHEERVAVLVFSEFGRRVAENGSLGTDHGTAAPVFVAGGRVRGGLVGTTPSLTDLVDGDLRPSLDFRRVYATLLEDWLGLPARAVLGGAFERLPLFRI
jgi:uncharacterized protein (DUF1501 family)